MKIAKLGQEELFGGRGFLSSRIFTPAREDCPKITLLVGPNRSGTSALCKAFSYVMPAYYQPLKSMVRYGGPALVIPGGEKAIFIKETLGIWREEETTFDPISALIEAGVPREKISFVPLLRDPLDTYDSWLEVGADASIGMFLRAFDHIFTLCDKAAALGVNTVPFDYELLRTGEELVMRNIFDRIGLDYMPSVVNWPGNDYLAGGRISISAEANSVNYREVCLDQVFERGGLRYIERERKCIGKQDFEILLSEVYPRYMYFADLSRNYFWATSRPESLVERAA
ncbi:MAG: hypothetical protein KDD66_14750 [Bdellovibrionales bacterium]|nr:hypothetical protein [Bdellovibrionales bacterium]